MKNLKTGRELFKYLIRECEKLPKDAEKFYKHSIKQSFKQHKDETDPIRIKEMFAKSLEDAKWIKTKYKT